MLNLNTNITWKNIKDYEDLYEVSSEGQIRSKKTNKILKPWKRKGYFTISLCKKSIPKKYYVHRIVAETFIKNPNNKPQVNHIDGNKLKNTVVNMEWVTCSENHLHAYKIGLKDPKTACPPIGNNKGKSSKYMYVTHFINHREDKYTACIKVGKFIKSKSFSVKKYGNLAETLAAEAANTLIDIYPEFQNRLKNVF